MRNRPLFEFGNASWAALLPARPWTPAENTVGGVRVSGAGVPAGYVVRRDALLDVPLRFWEEEWEALLALVAYAQGGASFWWTPDLEGAPTTSFEVYLAAPTAGEKWAPTRSGDYPRVLEVTLTLRDASGLGLWTPYAVTEGS